MGLFEPSEVGILTIDDMVDELLNPNALQPIALTEQAQELFQMREQSLTRIVDPELSAVVNEIRLIASANIGDIFEAETIYEATGINEDGEPIYEPTTRLRLKDVTTLPREITAAIQSIETDGRKIKVKMYDKQIAQDKLMKHYGGYASDNQQKAQAHEKLLDMLFLGAEAQGLPVPKSNDA